LSTIGIILVFGAFNRLLNRHLEPSQRLRFTYRPQLIR
jgi:hypothetical protein